MPRLELCNKVDGPEVGSKSGRIDVPGDYEPSREQMVSTCVCRGRFKSQGDHVSAGSMSENLELSTH